VVAGPLSNLHRAVGPFPTLEVTRLTTPAAVAGLSTRQPGRTTTPPSEKIREKIPWVIVVNKGHARSTGARRLPNAPLEKGPIRHLRRPAVTPSDPPTDQKVGGSSPSERAEYVKEYEGTAPSATRSTSLRSPSSATLRGPGLLRPQDRRRQVVHRRHPVLDVKDLRPRLPAPHQRRPPSRRLRTGGPGRTLRNGSSHAPPGHP